jgi:2-phosphosulfolactate phosphatase
MAFAQARYDLRCEWGLQGVLALAPSADAVIVVDVLSFSTAVDIAVSRGASVLPYRWNDDSAAEFAARKGALLASRRSAQSGYSLSPASLETIAPSVSLVLPSPNGSTLCLNTEGTPAFTACLRNAPAVAKKISRMFVHIAVIPAGEGWSDGSLRPALEDLIGAGAVLSGLPGKLSPEAQQAVAAFEHFRHRLPDAISECGSGRELLERGFARDVELAAEYSVSATVPILAGDRFVDVKL